MRFFLDHDVPVSVGRTLRDEGHDAWTAADARLDAEPQDDVLTVYAAERGAALVTMDREFSERRRKNPIGWHIRLQCREPDAASMLRDHLAEVLEYLKRDHVTLTVSKHGVSAVSEWQ